MKNYEKLIMQRLRDIAGITKSTKRNEFKKKTRTAYIITICNITFVFLYLWCFVFIGTCNNSGNHQKLSLFFLKQIW